MVPCCLLQIARFPALQPVPDDLTLLIYPLSYHRYQSTLLESCKTVELIKTFMNHQVCQLYMGTITLLSFSKMACTLCVPLDMCPLSSVTADEEVWDAGDTCKCTIDYCRACAESWWLEVMRVVQR
ncbi:uncharacterized protein LOC141596419 isoform X2 [Silene latifolia]|uniref:uncharacterized protein LOC141596419 isoform X2 n=2 Tax=Silene latifolia TaxID=37657 RepID=UPI003D77D12C